MKSLDHSALQCASPFGRAVSQRIIKSPTTVVNPSDDSPLSTGLNVSRRYIDCAEKAIFPKSEIEFHGVPEARPVAKAFE